MYKDADAKIIEILERDASLTNREIGEKLGLPTTTIHNKIRRLEKDGTIKRYTAIFNKAKIGLPITAVIQLGASLSGPGKDKPSPKDLADKIRKLGKLDCVLSLTGDFDMLIRVSVANTQELNDLVTRLRRIDGITKTVTNIVLEEFD
jgi:Lrp/AsnC family leucine-responsive transcriptional regulator